tara:strand:+ start:972 stop:1382 length:411 start_codon:yes stop_codon:yes gene_type:complete
MAAGRYSFTIEQGATLNFEIQYKDSGSIPIDLTGYDARMEIRSTFSGSGVTYLTFTSSIGDTYTELVDNSFLSLSGSNLTTPLSSGSIGVYAGYELTDTLVFQGEAFYDLEITDGVVRTRILEGRVRLSPQTTENI